MKFQLYNACWGHVKVHFQGFGPFSGSCFNCCCCSPTYQHLQQCHCYPILPLWRDGGQLCLLFLSKWISQQKNWKQQDQSLGQLLQLTISLSISTSYYSHPYLKSIQNSKNMGVVSAKKADKSVMSSKVWTYAVSCCWNMRGKKNTKWVNMQARRHGGLCPPIESAVPALN